MLTRGDTATTTPSSRATGSREASRFSSGKSFSALLGALALRLGRRIDWDAERMEARGIAEAEPIIREPYRAGWEPS